MGLKNTPHIFPVFEKNPGGILGDFAENSHDNSRMNNSGFLCPVRRLRPNYSPDASGE